MDIQQQAERLQALWKSGRDKYLSFFTVLEEVRQEIGSDALPRWCAENLRIGLSVIIKHRKLLQDVDAEIVRRNTAAAVAADKAQAQKARDEITLARELKKQEHAQKILQHKIDTQQRRIELERLKTETSNTKETRQRKQRSKRQPTTNVSDADLDTLSKKFKEAESLCEKAANFWVEGSVAKALVLCAARGKHTSDQEFGAWCKSNSILVNDHDRAALINLGGLGETKLRELLIATDRRSYQTIWREHNKPELKVIERS